MDFKDQIKQIVSRIESLKDNLPTEEATKNALIMPFLSALGYDVFNPLEVLPEMTCDIGTKKGEKIDYAILMDGKPVILVECKHWQQDLNLHDNQLLRYFNVSAAKFGILTNGIIYRFYTDLAEPNKMDEKPFLEVNMLDLKDNQIDELKKFHKSYFNIDTILSSASELKYSGELKAVIANEFANPSAEFAQYLAKPIYDGRFTKAVTEQFTDLVKKSISSYINDLISARLKAAMQESEKKEEGNQQITDNNSEQAQIAAEEEPNKTGIITTEEEIEGFYIVKSIVRETIEAERVTHNDSQTYFSVIADNNIRKLICRLYFNSAKNKYVVIPEGKDKKRYDIKTLDDIFALSNILMKAASQYKDNKSTTTPTELNDTSANFENQQ